MTADEILEHIRASGFSGVEAVERLERYYIFVREGHSHDFCLWAATSKPLPLRERIRLSVLHELERPERLS